MNATLVIATGNRHKVEEIHLMLPSDLRVLSLADFSGLPAITEDETTFAGNAVKKVNGLSDWLNAHAELKSFLLAHPHVWILADDSGLEVDALQGAPGVYSARFASMGAEDSKNASDEANNAKLLSLLASVPLSQRTGRFKCVLALARWIPGNHIRNPRLFEGVCEGIIAFEASGKGGFGYDPLFIPEGYHCSFAELGSEIKNRISHRARALEQLKSFWLEVQK